MTAPTVIYTCGMSGIRCFDRRFVDELRRRGLTVRAEDWTAYRWPLRNLRDREQHRRAVDQLLETIRTARNDQPNVPVALIGHSTGCLIVLEALERLPKPIDTALLLAAAVRPDYDLTPALSKCERLIHIGSRVDLWFCGIGTTACGTADGRHRPAAACVGFQGPGRDDPRFSQHMFRLPWWLHGHYGGHIGSLSRRFVRRRIVPLLHPEPERHATTRPPRTDVAEPND